VGEVVEFARQTSIEQQARRWLIRMDADKPLSKAEQKQLKEWLSSNPAHRDELVRVAQFWNQANVLTQLLGFVYPEERKRVAGQGTSRFWAAFLAGGAVLASVLTVCFGLQSLNKTVALTYETAIGQQKTIFLSDGSSIQLNTNTRVDVTSTLQARQLRLSRGEAFFTAAPDPNRMFKVLVGNSVVRAIGTEFAIHLEGQTVNLVVTKGAVEVSSATDTKLFSDPSSIEGASPQSDLGRLEAGEATRFEGGSVGIQIEKLSEQELQRRLAWQEGYLAFSGEPLADVVTQLNRYSTIQLSIGEPKLKVLPIGGNFKIGDLDGVLDLFQSTLGVRARWEGDHHVVLESKRGG
jgi:transmembrane sensor